MKSFILLLVISFCASFGQTPFEKSSISLKNKLSSVSDNSKILVWIFFKDKGNSLNKYYTTSNNVVSNLSLKRREKVRDKSSLIDFTDLPVNNDYVSKLQSEGFEVKQISKWFNGVSGYITRLGFNNVVDLPFVDKADIVNKYKKPSDIKDQGVELNKIIHSNKPSDINSLNYGPSFAQLQQINVPALHDQGLKGQGITICVMDAGVSLLSHEAFDSLKIIATYDFVNHRTYIGDGLGGFGQGSHGTMTLSLIGGYKPGQIIGPAYGANFLLAKTENTASESPIEEDNWIAALEWADSIGVDVTSTSLGYLAFDDTVAAQYQLTWQNMDGKTSRITQGALLAARKGIVVVNAAGNEGFDPIHNTLDAPADADSIITAGAVDISGARGFYSSVGNTIDGRIKPDIMALGTYNYVADPSKPSGYINLYYGTSFACPLIAGVCAQLLSYNPSLTPIQVRDALRNTASQHNNPDRLMGWGIIDALAALNYIKLVSIGDDNPNPDNFILYQNYPNPFNPTTNIKFYLPRDINVKVILYNILGNQIKTLYEGFTSSGIHDLTVDASKLSSGVYFVKLLAGDFQEAIKITLLK
jgi:serine protease AprX